MNVEFTTTELITDEEILSAFGESIRFDEGKFKIDSFIDCLEDRADVMAEERIREELTKCFKCNSSLTLGWLSELTELRDYIFTKTSLWLKPTNEK